MDSIQILLLFCCVSATFGRSFSYNSESNLIANRQYYSCGRSQVGWCENFDSAITCDAVQHCVRAVWTTHKPAHSSNVGACQSCESNIKKFRHTLGANATEKMAQPLLENICALNRVGPLLRKRCERLVARYVDRYRSQLLDLLNSPIDPATVCGVLRLCADAAQSTATTSSTPKNTETDVGKRTVIWYSSSNLINESESTNTTVPGSATCTWGPSYWCANISAAKECHTMSHCIRNVWPQRHFDEDVDSVCQVCQHMVQEGRDVLLKNQTQRTLRNVFEHSCKVILIRRIRTECWELVDKFVPELMDVLASKLKPTAVCTVLGLCNSALIDNWLTSAVPVSSPAAEKAAAAAVLPDLCANCTAAALTTVRRFAQNAPNSRHLYGMLCRLCDEMTSGRAYSEACRIFVAENFDQIYDTAWLPIEVRPLAAICRACGMCGQPHSRQVAVDDGTAVRPEVDAVSATANLQHHRPCDLCPAFLTHVKNMLTANTGDKFGRMLEGIRKRTASVADDCWRMVDVGCDVFYKFLTNEMDPAAACSRINLRPKPVHLPDEDTNSIDSRRTPVSTVETALVNVAGPAECRLCKTIIQVVRREIVKPQYKHDIQKLLKHVCSLVPRIGRRECTKFIDKYGSVLIGILVHQTDPNAVCSLLKECPGVRAASRCELYPLCQDVMRLIQQQKLDDPEVKDHVSDIVREICRLMPAPQIVKCKFFIDDYSKRIIDALSEHVNPGLVCPALKLCPTHASLNFS